MDTTQIIRTAANAFSSTLLAQGFNEKNVSDVTRKYCRQAFAREQRVANLVPQFAALGSKAAKK